MNREIILTFTSSDTLSKVIPNMIQTSSKTMNSIPNNEGDIIRERISLQPYIDITGLNIVLRRKIIEAFIDKGFDCGLKISDVLIGPFDL